MLDDSTDETTAIAARLVEEIRAEGIRIELIHRDHRSGYKAGALAEGLERSEADLSTRDRVTIEQTAPLCPSYPEASS